MALIPGVKGGTEVARFRLAGVELQKIVIMRDYHSIFRGGKGEMLAV